MKYEGREEVVNVVLCDIKTPSQHGFASLVQSFHVFVKILMKK
jgi:hypothetical protein